MTDNKNEARPSESPQAEVAEKLDAEDHKENDNKQSGNESLQGRLETAEAKAEENYDRFLRLSAEFENYKKRMEKEMDDFRKYANESLLKDILPVIDNFERALATPCQDNEKETLEAMHKGVEMTLKGLMDSLKKFGVVPLESLAKPFDPNFHHAVSQEETEEYPENTVCQELQKGYMLRERLLRPSLVVVSKKPESRAEGKSVNTEDDTQRDVTVH